MIEQRPAVELAIQTVAAAQGYSVQLSAEEHAGRKFYLTFTSAAGNQDRIEVDVNYLFRIPLVEPETRELWQPGEVAFPECRTVGHAELWIGKLCALLDRCAPRDLYDAALSFNPEEERLEDGTFKSLFVAMAGAPNHPLHTYSRKRLERITATVVEEQLYPMLTGGDRPAVTDLLDAAWEFLGPLLDLNDAEREFIDRFQVGELEPQLLFPEQPDMSELLARHPVLLWKAQNAREHQRRRRS